jgi:hypothetical protein
MRKEIDPKSATIIGRADEALKRTPEFQRFVATVNTIREVMELPPTAVLAPDGKAFILPVPDADHDRLVPAV